MTITPSLFEAFLKCPTKCWLRATNEQPAGNIYADWVKTQNESYRVAETNRMIAEMPPPGSALSPPAETLKLAKWLVASNVVARTPELPCSSRREEAPSSGPQPHVLPESGAGESLARSQPSDQSLVTSAATIPGNTPQPSFVAESRVHVVERVPAEGRGKAAQFIPIRFIFFNKLTKEDKLLLAYDALVLRQVLGRDIAVGKLVHGDDHAALKVKTSALAGEVRKRLEKIAALLSSSAPPDLVLNRHCAECEFHDGCRQKAIEKDDLSLLGGMGAKERQKLCSKGIFTITQLSYTFRPRRRPKWLRDKREKYHHSLKALAIREKKVHIVGSPELKIEGTTVYLDVEGLPDRDFYYLIGLRIGNGNSAVQHSLWADTAKDEGEIWREFLAILETVEKPVLIHYGSYETTFLSRMVEKNGQPPEGSSVATAIKSPVNLLSTIFARVYFPVFSNSLKDVAKLLGFAWTEQTASGLKAIVLRTDWSQQNRGNEKAWLVGYNQEDCAALELVAKAIHRIAGENGSSGDAQLGLFETIHVDSLRNEHTTKWDRFKSPITEFEVINNAAHWDYQRDRVYLRSSRLLRRVARKKASKSKSSWRVDGVLPPPTQLYCPNCRGRASKNGAAKTRIVQDIVFGRNSLKRRVFQYYSQPCWCPHCKVSFDTGRKCPGRRHFGRNLIALLFYQTVELSIPGQVVCQSLKRLYGFNLKGGTVAYLKEQAAAQYRKTQELIMKRIVSGNLVHVDETHVSIKGKRAYVWVFASMHEVVYSLGETRESTLVQDTLHDFKGVVVSDFYAVYDSLECPQQKCLIHLIRDLNTAVLDHPYDEELKRMIKGFAELTRPIIATVDRRGLKRHFLAKHKRDVVRFYRRFVDVECHTEAALKCKERFQRNRDKLFTFLNHDGVPWNNNNAEHAMKAVARLRDVLGGASTPSSIEAHLVLLSVCQTCKYMGLDFLDFLRSGETDIHAYAESRRRRGRQSSGGRKRRQRMRQ